MQKPPDAFESTRRSLLTRLKHWDDQEGWQRFFDTYGRLLFSVARRAGLNDADAEDVVQETIMAVAKAMPNFRYDPERGSFKNWLALIARRQVIQLLRRRGRQPSVGLRAEAMADEGTGTAPIERLPDPNHHTLDAAWEEEWEKNLFDAALLRIKGKVDVRHLQVFDCYVIKGWPVDEIEKKLRVSTSHIYTIKHRITALIKEEVQRLEKEAL